MLKRLDELLSGITMYRLMLYCLIFLVLAAMVLGSFKLIPFTPLSIVLSLSFLTLVCWVTNKIFAKFFHTFTNLESVYITALILGLILTPLHSVKDIIPFVLIAFLSQASKYILAINRKHLFNPAAIAITASGILGFGASWWVGTTWMLPFLLIVGFLITKKVKRFSLVISFLLVAVLVILGFTVVRGFNPISVLQNTFLESPLLFFAFIMLTEPLTSPTVKRWQIGYGVLVGLLYTQTSPEVALLTGNIFSFIVNPRKRLLLKLKNKIELAPDIYDFAFEKKDKLKFLPGQYLEWTLSHPNPDSRGVRRYFTIASSPTEGDLHMGVKFYPNSSSFKKALLTKDSGSQIFAGELSGEFILPKDQSKKLCFIAGGIGITPYRSMIQYLLDTNQRRDIILFYSNKTESEIVYQDVFSRAGQNLGVRTVYVVTEKVGYIDEKMIIKEVPDFKDRVFYISGPHSMVDVFEGTLNEMKIPRNQIKVDFFPGYV